MNAPLPRSVLADRDELARFASDKAPAPKTPPGSPIGEDCWFCTPLDLTRD